MRRTRDWGPASALAEAMERDEIRQRARWVRTLEAQLWGVSGVSVRRAYVTPCYALRRRASYGGKKGRAAVRRLKALGLGPVRQDVAQAASSGGV